MLSQVDASSADVDEDLIAILNDTHVGAQHPPTASIPTNLRNTVAWLLAQPKRPAAVIINGDLALNTGQPGDYTHFAKLIAPLREASVPVHLTMGNHDNRDAFYEVLNEEKPKEAQVASKHVSVAKMAKANLFLLDSLKAPMIAQGLLGDEQLGWLMKALDAHTDKPALIIAHHNPRLGGEEKHFPGGLEDSAPLWQAFASRPQVKAYIHGHIHHRDFFSHGGVHIVNTPAVGFVSNPAKSTTGWTMLRFMDGGAQVTTHTHLPEHAWNGMTMDLKWRT